MDDIKTITIAILKEYIDFFQKQTKKRLQTIWIYGCDWLNLILRCIFNPWKKSGQDIWFRASCSRPYNCCEQTLVRMAVIGDQENNTNTDPAFSVLVFKSWNHRKYFFYISWRFFSLRGQCLQSKQNGADLV